MGIAHNLLAALGATVLALTSSAPALAVELVEFHEEAKAGTIVVMTSERRLYYTLGSGQALRYPVGVGRPGRQWSGAVAIAGKHIAPNWAPPAEIKRDRPGVPDIIEGGSPANPMGAAALTLSGGSYAIHGTNAPDSIGGFVSYGCIRMFNADIVDLFDRVAVGTPVVVMQ